MPASALARWLPCRRRSKAPADACKRDDEEEGEAPTSTGPSVLSILTSLTPYCAGPPRCCRRAAAWAVRSEKGAVVGAFHRRRVARRATCLLLRRPHPHHHTPSTPSPFRLRASKLRPPPPHTPTRARVRPLPVSPTSCLCVSCARVASVCAAVRTRPGLGCARPWHARSRRGRVRANAAASVLPPP